MWQVDRKELAKHLRTSRALRDETQKSVETRLAQSLANHFTGTKSDVFEMIGRGVGILEGEVDETIDLDADDLRVLAQW